MTDLTRWFYADKAFSYRLEFNIADAWIGAYWSGRSLVGNNAGWDLWICLLPCLPLHIRYTYDTKIDQERLKYKP